ncbi:E3 ubiquitin-protein ligase pellino homolog 2, partial [Carassius gibelio]|uniref:E3 ubiquitin-protein ligase pellino homolog 2 n=1 Tax=Carassius gibelio TaxID=101364 RepID=UPI002277FCA9
IQPGGFLNTVHCGIGKLRDLSLQAVNSRGQHSISFTLSRNQTVVVEYCHEDHTDMFQVSRSTESPIDFMVTDTQGASQESEDSCSAPSTISPKVH